MAVVEPRRSILEPTHEVLNQPPPLVHLQRVRAGPAAGRGARARGRRLGRRPAPAPSGEIAGGEAIEWGRQANENPPVLRTHDRYGNRIDEVEYHPAYHELMDVAVVARAARRCRGPTPRPGAHVARAAMFIVWCQVEGGHVLPDLDDLLRRARRCAPRPSSPRSGSRGSRRRAYDPRLVPAADKAGALVRHGDDREAGRLRRARQHHASPRR